MSQLIIGDTPNQWQLSAVVYAVAVFIVIALTGVNLGRSDASQTEFPPIEQPVAS